MATSVPKSKASLTTAPKPQARVTTVRKLSLPRLGFLPISRSPVPSPEVDWVANRLMTICLSFRTSLSAAKCDLYSSPRSRSSKDFIALPILRPPILCNLSVVSRPLRTYPPHPVLSQCCAMSSSLQKLVYARMPEERPV